MKHVLTHLDSLSGPWLHSPGNPPVMALHLFGYTSCLVLYSYHLFCQNLPSCPGKVPELHLHTGWQHKKAELESKPACCKNNQPDLDTSSL